MYGVRVGSTRRGLAAFDVSNPAACGFTDLGVTKGICWCLSVGQTLCDALMGSGTYAAAVASQAPDVAYPPMTLPAAPPAVTNTGVSPTIPPTADQAQAAIDASLAQAKAQTNQQNLDYFKQVAANLDQLGGTGGLSTTAIIALGLAAAGALLLLSSGRGRR